MIRQNAVFVLAAVIVVFMQGALMAQITTYPYTEDFETATGTTLPTGWSQSAVDQRDWDADTGGTGSTGTGPSIDHTLGTTAGTYIYFETSSPVAQGDEAIAVSPQFDWTSLVSVGVKAELWYHMLGNNMGTMHVDLLEQFNSGANGDLVVAGPTFSSATSTFTSAHVGSTITISGSANGNDGVYTIAAVVNSTTVTLATTPPGTDESGITFVHELFSADIIAGWTDNVDQWQLQTIPVSPALLGGGSELLFRLHIRGVCGSGFTSDMAFDDFSISDFPGPEIDVQRPAGTSVANAAADNLGVLLSATVNQVTYTVLNQGFTNSLDVTSVTATPTGVQNCTVTASPTLVPSTTIGPNGSSTFTIDVTPTISRPFEFTIVITSTDADEPTITIVVSGEGRNDPEIDVQRPAGTSLLSGVTQSVGQTVVGVPSTFTWTIENLGVTSSLDITSISVAPSGFQNCTVTPSPTLTPSSPIATGTTASFDVDVTATAAGPFGFRITINSSDADESAYIIDVIGGTDPLSGTFTVAKGNLGELFDCGDIGAMFSLIEALGLAGPVTLDVYDDGGTFASTAAYTLGDTPVTGLSAANTITVRAATGESPAIDGSLAGGPFGIGLLGTISFLQMGFTTVEGIEVSGGGDFGIGFIASTASFSDIIVSRCTVHDILGPGIWLYNDQSASGFFFDNVTVTNNFVYDVQGDSGPVIGTFGPFYGTGGIGFRCAGTNWTIQHNTVVMNRAPGAAGAGAIAYGVTLGPGVADLSYNILVATVANTAPFNLPLTLLPQSSDFNILSLQGGATNVQIDTQNATGPTATLAAWQTASSLDASSVDTDPNLVSVTSGSEDLRLSIASTNAIDAATGSTLTLDHFGSARPQGSANDIGAHEFVAQEIDVQRPAGTSLGSGTAAVGDSLGNVSTGGETFVYTIENLGDADLDLTGTSIVDAPTAQWVNCTVVVDTSLTADPVTGRSTTTFSLTVTPGEGVFSFDLVIASNDADEGTYTINVDGTGVAGGSGGGGGGGDDGGCSTGGNGHYSWMILLGLLSAFVVFTRVRGGKA